MGGIAVVGKDEKTGGLEIEASDVEETLVVPGNKIPQVASTAVVREARHNSGRLVQHDIPFADIGLDRFAVNSDSIDFGVDTRTKFGDRLAVDRNPSLRDEDFARTTRRYPRRGEDFLKSVSGHRRNQQNRRRAVPKRAEVGQVNRFPGSRGANRSCRTKSHRFRALSQPR